MRCLRSPSLIAWMLVLALAGVSACSVPQRELQEPEFRLTRVEPLQLGLLEQRFRLTFAVDNPNSVSLPVRTLNYRVSVGGMDFAEGFSAEAFTIPARDTGEFSVEARTNLMDSLPRLLDQVRAGERRLDYRLDGEVEYGRFFRGKRDFQQTGTVRLDLF
ncbi:MAG: LEA type 2 family protein [Ectothiorhodospiraceae bacterium]|nr:LEA type 2 family protein [Ectothiorhodospiraceae bacterium]